MYVLWCHCYLLITQYMLIEFINLINIAHPFQQSCTRVCRPSHRLKCTFLLQYWSNEIAPFPFLRRWPYVKVEDFIPISLFRLGCLLPDRRRNKRLISRPFSVLHDFLPMHGLNALLSRVDNLYIWSNKTLFAEPCGLVSTQDTVVPQQDAFDGGVRIPLCLWGYLEGRCNLHKISQSFLC